MKPKWLTRPRFQSHMKTDITNRLADPENLYIRFQGNYKGKKIKIKSEKKN